MSVSNPLTFPKSASSYSVRIRWFVENCCEIRLSNGKTIVIDTCLPEPGKKWIRWVLAAAIPWTIWKPVTTS